MSPPDADPPAAPVPSGGMSPALSPPVLALACALLVALLVWTSGWLRFDDPDDRPLANRPVFVGEVTPGATSVALTLLPTGERWTAPVDPTSGAFEVVFPAALAPGSYALYVDDALGREFVVGDDQP